MIYFGNNNVQGSISPNPSINANNAENLVSNLSLSSLIDDEFEVLKEVTPVALNPIIKKRLRDLFDQAIVIKLTPNIVGKFSLKNLVGAIFEEVKKLAFSKNFKLQLKGSKVLDVLGQEFAEDLFRSLGINLTCEQLSKIKNTKKSYDLDLAVWMPEAGFNEREEILKAVERALFTLFRPKSILSNEALKDLITHNGFLEKPANIVDGKSQFLNTCIGSEASHIEFLWIQSFERQEIFCKDSRYIEFPLDFFENESVELKVLSSENILKPFIDLIFDLLIVRNPSTVNKRGLSRLHLEEAQGKRLLKPEIENIFFKTALAKQPKNVARASYFLSLVNFCFRKHADDAAAFFILFLKMGSLLINNLGSSFSKTEADEYKKGLPENLKFENELFHIIYSYCLRPDTALSDVLTLTAILQSKFLLVEKGFKLNVKWNLAHSHKIPDPKLNQTIGGIKVLIAMYEAMPSSQSREDILVRLPLDVSDLPKPILGLADHFFDQVALFDSQFPGEGYIRAFLSDSALFSAGVRKLGSETFRFNSILLWLISRNLNNAFRLFKIIQQKLTLEERQNALNAFIKGLPKSSAEATLTFPYEELAKEVDETKLKKHGLDFEDLTPLLTIPTLGLSLIPYIYQDRFVLEDRIDRLVSVINETPLDQVESYGKNLSSEKMQLIFSAKQIHPSKALGRLARVYLTAKVSTPILFRMIFFFRFNAEDLTPPLYTHVIQAVTKQLKAILNSGKELGKKPSEEIAIEAAIRPESDLEFTLVLLETKIISSSQGVSSVMPKILAGLNSDVIQRVWTWAVNSSFRETFLLTALNFPAYADKALLELEIMEAPPEYFLSISRSLLKKKAFVQLFCFIRAHERVMKKDPSWKAHLEEVYQNWLSEKLNEEVLALGFETYAGLSTPMDEMLLHILWKLDDKNSPELRKKIIKYLLANFTLENILKKEPLFNLLLKNISYLTVEELSEYDEILSQMAVSTLNASQEEYLLKIIVSKKVTSVKDKFFPLIKRFKEHPKLKETFRDLALQSEEEALFSEGLQMCFKTGFPRSFDRMQVFAKMLKIVPPFILQDMLKQISRWSPEELAEIFKILSLKNEYHESLEELSEAGFFNPILQNRKNLSLIRTYINHSLDDWELIRLAKLSFFKKYLSKNEGYQIVVNRLEHCIAMGQLPLVEAWAELDWNEAESLSIMNMLFRNSSTSLKVMVQFYKKQSEKVQAEITKQLYKHVNNQALINRFLTFHLHDEMPFNEFDEIIFCILKTLKDSDPSEFYYYYLDYINLCFYRLGKENAIEYGIVDYSQGGRSYKSDNQSVGTFFPTSNSPDKRKIIAHITHFLNKCNDYLQEYPDEDHNYLRDFIFNHLLKLINRSKEAKAKASWAQTFTLFIEACGNHQMYVKHMEMCQLIHNKACMENYYESEVTEKTCYYFLGLAPIEPHWKVIPIISNDFLRDASNSTKNLSLLVHHAIKILRFFLLEENLHFHINLVKKISGFILENEIIKSIGFTPEQILEAFLPPIGKKFPLSNTLELLREVDQICRKLTLKYESLEIKFAFCKVALRRGYLINFEENSSLATSCGIISSNMKQLISELDQLNDLTMAAKMRQDILSILENGSSNPQYSKFKLKFLDSLKS